MQRTPSPQPWFLLILKSNMNTLKQRILSPLLAVSVLTGSALGVAALASAQTQASSSGTQMSTTDSTTHPMMHPGFGHGPRGHGVQGTVSAISGNTITVTHADGTTYTIDASKAKVTKMVELSVSDIKIGDTIGAEGAVSGTIVTANHIMDGVPMPPVRSSTTTQ